MNIISQHITTDSRGVQYQESVVKGRRIGTRQKFYPVVMRRISPRPVDIKRAERASKRLQQGLNWLA